MKTRDGGNSALPQHLQDEDLIAYLDGEMARDEQDKARVHLESCWGCRSRLHAVQGSIESFLAVRQESLLPPELPPSGPTVEQFRNRLSLHISAPARQHSHLRLAIAQARTIIAFLKRRASSLSANPALVARVTAGLLVAAIIAALVFISDRVQPVSASELLRQAGDAQEQQLRATAQPVVHQKLRVKRKAQQSAGEDSITVEVWDDAPGSRFKRVVHDRAGRPVAGDRTAHTISNTKISGASPTLAALENSLRANHMEPRRPLSPSSYEAWRKSVERKREEVIRTTHPDGVNVLTLKTVPEGPIAVGQIAEARYVVRARDWHPVEEYLRVRGEGADEEYELSEMSYEVVSLNALGHAFFAESQLAAGAEGAASPSPSPSAELSPAPPVSETQPRPAATADLEVEVLRLLNQAGANLGEQVGVTRSPEGQLYVLGIVETDRRKAEIMRVLEPVLNNPAVIVKINTVAEAMKPGAKPSDTVTVQGGTITEGATIPVYTELRRYFAARGISEELIDENIRRLSGRMLGRSRQALRHAWALRNLSGRFTLNDLSALSADARAKWLQIIRQHAQMILQETRTLRQELEPVFANSAGPPSGGSVIKSDADLTNALGRIVELCSRNDEAIRGAFTVSSSDGGAPAAVRTQQFWQSLRDAEALAAAIQDVARKN